ncbi:CDP-diacylglycerol--glycerol-3-phosphate 3-phosphatidyltransferase [Agathobaculum sp. NTUH-O15-33]|uniref:CDP-diacylglycerol--glycerol-3-phosphate 3-phosphatidyltransferase n=1 Tax=Agathobaculum sp. NTUH-O15-33 TaxID=3079302 RepID=UPI0029587028|nr:CDP-diacylglycerol--glycerol-3-phosphate 3-phosphatidyltransferase [Agathobaculum sp. NTUH-O15-33]WNX84829.1 CDP-diacylglycerol--glycerol-3-phosphate 3-phosphatidyltransferase [Agathobaculum sp. NTUH-O15-33]
MTTANKITIIRILMIPFFIFCAMQQSASMQIAALVLFCVASFTDFLDGYVARKYNQVTDFGKFVDPLADKLLVTAALLIFIEKGIFPAWMVFIILAREFIITSLRIVAANKGRVLAATWTGKVKTCVQIAGIILDFLFLILLGSGESSAALGMIGGADGPTAILVANTQGGTPQIPLLIAVVMTIVTLYSGFDYLRKNWDLIKDGAVKQ